MKALLLRLGIDKGCGGALAPLFADGSFEYISIPERRDSRETRTFGNTVGVHARPLSTYNLPKKLEHVKMHVDPEFETYTYGDPSIKRTYLLKLDPGDLLVFYAGLQPWDYDGERALYIIGYFTVETTIDMRRLSDDEREDIRRRYPNNAHVKRQHDDNAVIVIGDPTKSRLLHRAIRISVKRPDRRGRPMHAVSEEIARTLGIAGFIQQSVPPKVITAEYVGNVMKLLGVPSVS
jgi:hypothetical protein